MSDIIISGVPFRALAHRDGRFVHAPGLFAFARRGPDGRHTVLHLEMSGAIDRHAGPDHPRWSWALEAGMDTLLIHLFGRPVTLAHDAPWETVLWHPQAQVDFLERGDGAAQQPSPHSGRDPLSQLR